MYLHPRTRALYRQFNLAHTGDTAPSWAPQVDIHEDAAGFVLLMDVPGVDLAAINIEAKLNELSISGERSPVTLAEGQQTSRSERRFGQFERRFSLPESADTEAITASGDNGVLQIRIPKRAQVVPRKIQVSVAPLDKHVTENISVQ